MGQSATCSSVGGRVFVDANRNGIEDGSEDGASVTVQLVAAGADGVFGNGDDVVVATTTSNVYGYYSFGDVAPGKYQVQFSRPDGYAYTAFHQGSDSSVDSDANPQTGRSETFCVAAGDEVLLDAGLVCGNAPPPPSDPRTAALGDYVWIDANNNGQQDSGERGAAGVAVTLRDASGTAVASTTTDANGAYHFGGLAAGNYQVQFGTLSGYGYAQANSGSDASDSDADGSGRVQVTLATGQVDNSIDAGLVCNTPPPPPPAPASLGDRVWNDRNGNGQQDTGEAGVAGVSVQLMRAGGDGTFGTADDVVAASTTTDANGNYLFGNLTAGDYQVQFAKPAGYGYTARDVGADASDSDANQSTGRSQTVTLAAGETNLTIDAGVKLSDNPPPPPPPKGSIGDYVWSETGVRSTVDAIQGSGQETPVSGLCVWLRGTGADGKFGTADDINASTRTDATGHYSFNNLDAGDYQLQFGSWTAPNWNAQALTPSLARFGLKHQGNDPTRDSDVNTFGFTDVIHLAQGEVNNTIDAVLSNYSPIALDLDGNGIHTTWVNESRGAFDLLGDGRPVHSGWISSGDAFLAVDANHNGKVDGISELFGGDVGEGFAKLASYDRNHDGVVDAHDRGYRNLLVWQDLNGNHQTDEGELRTLAQAGIASLRTSYAENGESQNGNVLGETSSATRSDGSTIDMIDVYLQVGSTASQLLEPADTPLQQAFGSQHPQHGVAHGGHDDQEALRRLAGAMHDHAQLLRAHAA